MVYVRSFAFLFVLVLMCCALFASTVTIRVLDNWNTALYGTPVELLQKSVLVASATADKTGYAIMDVQDGEYIALVSRAGYPVFASVVSVQGKTDITLTAIQGRSYSVLYGTVYAEGGIPEGMKVSAMRDGIVQSSAKVYAGGSYVLQFLDDGQYELVASASEYAYNKIQFSVSGSETKLMDVNLKKKTAGNASSGTTPVQNTVPFVSIVEKGALYKPIRVRVGAGDAGAASVQVEALTPDGKVSLLTDESGVAVINAAKGGQYVFTYMGARSVVEVADDKKINAASDVSYAQALAAQQEEENALAAAAAAQKLAEQKQADANAAILFGVGTFALLAVVILVGAYFFMKRKKHAHHDGHAREHGHPGMHGTHTHEHAHEGHEHAHAKHGKE